MSYLQYKEKVFDKKGSLPFISILKSKNPGRLKSVTSLTDPRSWSLDPTLRQTYFLETFNTVSTSSSTTDGDTLLPPSPPKTPKKKKKFSNMAKAVKSRFFNRKVISQEQLAKIKQTNMEERLSEANESINQLVFEKEQLKGATEKYQSEIDNLRTLVNNIQDEIYFVHTLKAENTNLKAELSSDIYKKFSEAQDEINYLNSQIEIYKDYKCKYDNLKSHSNQLKEDYDQISLSLKEMEWNNEQLQSEIESLNGKLNGLSSRELVVSNAMVDKEVLRERLLMRDEKISCLVAFLEEQEMTIQELMLQLQRMTSNVMAKEGAIGRQVHSLKFSLYEKANRISELEDKLHSSELLIRELENLRDHFRLSNCALTENMQNYKKQFNMVVSCSKKLLAKIEFYKEEVYEKDLVIQKLSVFPQSASSIVQFAQLLNTLRSSEELIASDEHSALAFIPLMRRIVEQLKEEIVGNRIEYPLYEIYNSDTQTEFIGTDKCIQNEPFFIEDKFVEANLPDRYYFDYQKAQIKISELNNIIKTLQESFNRVDTAKHLLERKIISSIADKNIKEKEISDLQIQLYSANDSLQSLRSEILDNDSLLQKSIHEIELEKGLRESTSEILVATLDSTTFEYNMYIKVLETLLKYKEEKIQYLEDYLCNEEHFDQTPENEYITLLENEIKTLSVKYVNEKQNVKDLNIQIGKLQAALSEKMDHFKIVQEKLLRAEKIFEHLNNIESQCMLAYDNHSEEVTIIPTEEMVVTSSKILCHSERLESHLKEEKNLKEKLLRETVSREYVLSLIQRNIFQKRNLKKTINQLKCNINRIKSMLFKLRKQLKLSECINQDYSKRLSELDSFNSEIKKEKDFIMSQLDAEKSKTINLEMSVEMKCHELCDLKEKKRKVENILINIIKQFERRFGFGKQSKAVGTESELSYKNAETEISNLNTEICELTARNNSLSTVIANLEERLANILYIPQKDSDPPQTLTVEIQTEFNDDNTIKDIQNHYENIIEILQKDKAVEKEECEKQHINNLKKLKDTYEKEIKNIRKTHHKHLTKLQVLQEQDFTNLKEANQRGLEKQKLYYETLIKSKETEEGELSKEIKELKEEVGNIITQKQKDDSMFNEKIKDQLIEVKKKFKKHYKKLKKSYEAQMLQVINKHNDEIKKLQAETNISKLSVESQTLTDNMEELNTYENSVVPVKENQIIEEVGDHNNEIICSKKIDINFKERIQYSIKEANGMIPKEILHILNKFRLSGNSAFNSYLGLSVKNSTDSATNTPRLSETYDFILEKADIMQANFQDMLKNISSYSKHAAEERVIIEEIKELLNKERIHSFAVQERLSFEVKRADQLKTQKDELHKHLVELRKHLIDVESDLRLEKGKYENLKKSFTSIELQRRTSEQLEMSLTRLRTKLEKAVQCEKRLTEELEDDKKTSERIQVVIESNKIAEKPEEVFEASEATEDHNKIEELNSQECSEVTKDVEENERRAEFIDAPQLFSTERIQYEPTNITDLKVVFIQRCGVLHTWREQLYTTDN